ncbi:hypothetical protein SK128_007070 [Halocaridina rubra]|uniref:Uncharacterized protein n=1 Tax=Halocaridina rubra TaxID=373956 RepID=A0AAN8XAL3_HALRR
MGESTSRHKLHNHAWLREDCIIYKSLKTPCLQTDTFIHSCRADRSYETTDTTTVPFIIRRQSHTWVLFHNSLPCQFVGSFIPAELIGAMRRQTPLLSFSL